MSSRKMMPEFEFIVGGVALVCVGIIGCLLNILCITTFSRMSAQKNFHRLMLSLALFDTLYITTSIILFGVPALYPYVYNNSFYLRLIPIILPLIHIGLTGSIYFTVAIALERYTTVCHPFFKGSFTSALGRFFDIIFLHSSLGKVIIFLLPPYTFEEFLEHRSAALTHAWSAATYILPICIFSLLYNIPKFLELEIGTFPMNKTRFDFTNKTITTTTIAPEITESLDDDSMEVSSLQDANFTVYDNRTIAVMLERVVPSSLRKHPLYVQVYIIYLNLLVHGVIPLVLLVGLNIFTYKRLRNQDFIKLELLFIL